MAGIFGSAASIVLGCGRPQITLDEVCSYISVTGKPDLSEAGKPHPDLFTLVQAETAGNVEHPSDPKGG